VTPTDAAVHLRHARRLLLTVAHARPEAIDRLDLAAGLIGDVVLDLENPPPPDYNAPEGDPR
jgi:hypothetical protein